MKAISMSTICDVLGSFSLVFGIGSIVDFSDLMLVENSHKILALVGLITCKSIRLFINYIHNRFFLYIKIQII